MHYFLLILSIALPWLLVFFLVENSSAYKEEFEIVWEQDFEKRSQSFYDWENLPDIPPQSFLSPERIVSYEKEGKILHQKFLNPQDVVSIGECCYINSKKVDTKSEFFKLDGERLFVLEKRGYGILSPDGSQIVFLSTDSSSISLHDRTGRELLKNYFFDTLITDLSFSAYNNVLALASSNGKLLVVDHEGKIIFSEHLNQHTYPVVKSVQLSFTSEWLVALSGLEDEQLVVFKRSLNPNQEAYEQVWKKKTSYERLTHIQLTIDEDLSLLYEEIDGGFRRYDINDGEMDLQFSFDAPSDFSQNYSLFAIPNMSLKKQNQGEKIIAFVSVGQDSAGNDISQLALLGNEDLRVVWQANFSKKILNCRLIPYKQFLYLIIDLPDRVRYFRISNFSPLN